MKKLMNKKGFTLMEMLIVVAIIVILVAIAIPTFSSSLDDAKAATDDANLRGAKGVANAMDMTDGWGTMAGEEEGTTVDFEGTMFYNIETGAFQTSEPDGYGQSSDYKDDVIVVEIEDGELVDGYPKWSNDVE